MKTNKRLFSGFFASLCLTISAAPLAAAQTACTDKEPGKQPTEQSVRKSKVAMVEKVLVLPKAACGALAGVAIGVPVRIARSVSHETLRMREQLQDDFAGDEKPDLMARTLGSYLGMAYGIPSGIILGTIKGTERGIDAGSRKPFSKESFSITDPR